MFNNFKNFLTDKYEQMIISFYDKMHADENQNFEAMLDTDNIDDALLAAGNCVTTQVCKEAY